MFIDIARVILILLEVLVLFNLLIVVHELGHFLAARWRGLYIEKFGVWFGKPLWKKTINGVQYSLGSLPFGGFVALPQLAPMDIIEGKADVDRAKLAPISALDKIIVAVAGPLFSLLLALCFAGIVWVVGHPVGESDSTTIIGYVMPDSPAQKVGLQPGDKILEVDGKPVRRFLGMNDSVSWNVVRSEGDKIAVKFQRDGNVQTVWVEPYKAETRGWRRKSVRQLLIFPAETPIIEKVEPKTPAAAAGLRPNDIVRGFDQTPIYNPVALLEYISQHPKDQLILHVERGGARLDVSVRPTLLPTDGEMKPRIGRLALWFSVILNVNLAIINMVPLPVLDGGHVMLAMIEGVRRKPLNIRLLEIINTGCAMLIIGYMLYITFFDVQDLPFIKNTLDKLEVQPTPKAVHQP